MYIHTRARGGHEPEQEKEGLDHVCVCRTADRSADTCLEKEESERDEAAGF